MSASQVITSKKQIVEYYRHVNASRGLAVGMEWERSAVYRDTLNPVRYGGDRGYLAVLQKLVEEVGWDIVDGTKSKIIELERGNTRISTEPDGSLELAGSPDLSLHKLAREFRIHVNEVKEMGDIFNIAWISLGRQPFHKASELSFLDKPLYKIYRESVGEKVFQEYANKSNAMHINLSYTDEKNAIRKAQTALRITPIVGAMFASSPFDEGKICPYLNQRRQVNATFCPERTSLPGNFLDENFCFQDWIQNYLDTPVIYINRDGKEYFPKDMTFSQWMEKGYEGMQPTMKDFDKHVKCTWSDIRLRPCYLEYRVIDSVPLGMIMSVPALLKGLLFDSENWHAIEELTKDWSFDDIWALDRQAWKTGLQTEWKGKTLLWYAQELLGLANEKLHKFARTNGKSEDETIFLKPLKEQIYIKEKSLAEEMVELWNGKWHQDPKKLLEFCESR